MRILKRLIKVGLIVIFVVFATPFSAWAQATPDCTFDLSQASGLLKQAQSKQASGDIEGALVLLDQVTQVIDTIKAHCGTATNITLFSQYIEPHHIYTINYP